MLTDARAFPLLGTQVYAYGLLVMLGCWLAMSLLLWLTRGQPRERLAMAWTAVLGLPLGLALARLMYCLLDPGFAPFISLRNILALRGGGFAMYGALIGAVLAAWLSAKLTEVPAAGLLDRLAPALAAFLGPARLGEGFTALGISRPLTTPLLANSFLAFRDEYDAYLRTYLLEAAVAAILLAILLRYLRTKPRPGNTFLLFGLLYGLTQTLMESLRYDGHLRYSFVGVQQVLSAVLFSLVILRLALRHIRGGYGARLPAFAMASLAVTLPALVGIEFLIDRSELGKLFSYLLYLLALAIPGVLGILMLNKEDRVWTKG